MEIGVLIGWTISLQFIPILLKKKSNDYITPIVHEDVKKNLDSITSHPVMFY